MAPSVYRPNISLDLAPHEAIDPTTAILAVILLMHTAFHRFYYCDGDGEYDAALKSQNEKKEITCRLYVLAITQHSGAAFDILLNVLTHGIVLAIGIITYIIV